jgi:hypothetical protein
MFNHQAVKMWREVADKAPAILKTLPWLDMASKPTPFYP